MEVKSVVEVMLEVKLKEIVETNPYPAAESNGVWVERLVSTINQESFDEAIEGDLVINYDYWTDELQGDSDCEKWLEWYDDVLFSKIDELMSELGYNEVDSMDGSGGGLYYGAKLFRKK